MPEQIEVRYSANNSGGSWWLTDDHWLALEKAGWVVEWGGKDYCHSNLGFLKKGTKPSVAPNTCPKNGCEGHTRYASLAEVDADGGRFLGAPASYATFTGASPSEAIKSFEAATGLDVSEEGCGCCGPPHSFSWDGGYASGADVLPYLFPAATGLSAREMAKRLQGGPDA